MTLKIEVTVPHEQVLDGTANGYLANALSAIGYSRGATVPHPGECPRPAHGTTYTADEVEKVVEPYVGRVFEHHLQHAATVLDEPSVQAAVAKRERGKPSPGRARRTKEEIAEDEAAERADPAVRYFYHPESDSAFTTNDGSRPTSEDGLLEEVDAERYAAIQADIAKARANISTGEERINPEDAADEAAEQPQRSPLEQLRLLMGAVGRKHGLAYATQIPGKLGKPIAELTDEELPGAISQVQALLDADKPDEAPVTAVEKAVPQTSLAATKQDLMNAMFDYAEFADGTNDQTKMAFTMKDVPVVFEKLFGVQRLSEVPETGYGQAIEGIREMLAKDPFKRARG